MSLQQLKALVVPNDDSLVFFLLYFSQQGDNECPWVSGWVSSPELLCSSEAHCIHEPFFAVRKE